MTDTRPLKVRCGWCHEEDAARLLIDTNTGHDIPVCARCLRATGRTGRPLPQVTTSADGLIQRRRA